MAAIPDWQQPFRTATQEKSVSVQTIVVPLDGREVSRAALPVARRLARLYGATLHIIYVGEEWLGPRQTLQDLGIAPEEMRGAVLDQLRGDPAEAIVDILSRLSAPLLVMCSHTGNNVNRETLLGSVAEQVLAATPPRVLLVSPERGASPWELRNVLLTHDGSRSADAATCQAAEIAHLAGAEVTAMHVAAPSAEEMPPGSVPAPRYVDQPQHEWPAWASEFLNRMMALGSAPAKLRFKLAVTGGQPGSEVADFARDNRADLVVAVWHGRWHDQHGALQVIVRRSGCPVLLVYAPDGQS